MRQPPRGARGEAVGGAGGRERIVAIGEHVGDQLRCERSEQDAVAVVAGRPYQAPHRTAADHGRVVGGARPQANGQLFDLQLADTGDELARVAQQLIYAAGGRREPEATLLYGRAEHIAAVRAGTR